MQRHSMSPIVTPNCICLKVLESATHSSHERLVELGTKPSGRPSCQGEFPCLQAHHDVALKSALRLVGVGYTSPEYEGFPAGFEVKKRD